MMKVLILGGTTEASAIATGLAGDPGFSATLSLAGRTREPVLPAIAARRGGFGGVAGLLAYLRGEGIDALVDATHPFAAQMSRHAAAAAGQAGVARLAVIRPAWTRGQGDRWTQVADMAGAVAALGEIARKVFLTIGQQDLAPFRSAPWHEYLIRSVEPPDPGALPPRARCIAARGPFTLPAETALLQSEGIGALVTKNSGGSAVRAKLDAARSLGIEVVMVARPPPVEGDAVADADAALAWLRGQASARRGV